MATFLAVIGAITSVAGTLGAQKAAKKSAQAQRQQQVNQRRRSQRQAIRRAQIIRASSIATATGIGAGTGSGAQGGIGSIGSQLGGALGYSSAQSALSGIISRQNERQSFFSGIASIGASFASIGADAGGFNFLRGSSQGKDQTRDIFGP